jgi:type 1 glutamine amidotransferase
VFNVELRAIDTTKGDFMKVAGIGLLSFLLIGVLVCGCEEANLSCDKAVVEKVKQSAKVLIVTGVDYPGHKWKLTTPVLKEAIAADKRLAVTVTEKPSDLAGDNLGDYDVIVLHFMDWEVPDPGEKARANLKGFVENGGGLVLVHFACGAFQDWPEFGELAGRVWNPKLRGHDPRGPFKVDITEVSHPITRGMEPFETDDELYTCLAGDKPIKVLAKARSRVDGKDYPMAFVLDYGKGRVFHSVLGHDVKALANPPVGKLFRRACAWAANIR